MSGETLGATTADSEGNWETKLDGTLRPGANQVTVAFQETDGTWTKRVTQEVVRVAQTDAFRITTPADGSTVSDARPTIEGATAGSYRRVVVTDENGSTYAYGSSDADGDFRLAFDEDLREGVNTLSVRYQEQDGSWATAPYTLRYDAGNGEQPGEGAGEEIVDPGQGEGPGEEIVDPGQGEETPAPGAGEGSGEETPAPADVEVATTRLDDAEVVLSVSGAAGTEVSVTANGVTKHTTIGDEGSANVVIPAPADTTTTAHVTSTNGGRTAEQDVVVGDGAHPSDQVTAAVVSASALTGSAEIDVWGPASGIGGLRAEDADGKVLAHGTIGAAGSGHLTVTGLTEGEHVLTVVAGGLTTQVTVTI